MFVLCLRSETVMCNSRFESIIFVCQIYSFCKKIGGLIRSLRTARRWFYDGKHDITFNNIPLTQFSETCYSNDANSSVSLKCSSASTCSCILCLCFRGCRMIISAHPRHVVLGRIEQSIHILESKRSECNLFYVNQSNRRQFASSERLRQSVSESAMSRLHILSINQSINLFAQ